MKKKFLTLALMFPVLIMAQTTKQVTEDFLQSFANTFNAHDINAIMAHMTGDCIFEASAEPDSDGEKFSGQEEVKKAFENVFATFPDAHWGNARHFISGDRGFSEWIFTATKAPSKELIEKTLLNIQGRRTYCILIIGISTLAELRRQGKANCKVKIQTDSLPDYGRNKNLGKLASV